MNTEQLTYGETHLVEAVRALESASRHLNEYINYKPSDARAIELLEAERYIHARLLALCKDRKIKV